MTRRKTPKFIDVFKWLIAFFGTGVLYYISCEFSQEQTYVFLNFGPISLAAGIAVAGLLLFGFRIWPALAISALLSDHNAVHLLGATQYHSIPLALSLFSTASSVLQACLGAYLIKKYISFPPKLGHLNQVFKSMFLAGPIACLLNPTFELGLLFYTGHSFDTTLLINWLTSWFGESIGVVLFIPLVFASIGNIDPLRVRSRLLIIIPMVSLFVISLIIFFNVHKNEETRNELVFEQRANIIYQSLRGKFKDYIDVLFSIERLFSASSEVSRKEFRDFVQYALNQGPGIQALEWIPVVPKHLRQTYKNKALEDGLYSFTFTEFDEEGHLIPARIRDIYYPVYYLEPLEGNELAMGFNLASNAARLEALEKARDMGYPIASGRIRLMQTKSIQFGFLILLPIYKGGIIPGSTSGRRNLLMGYALGVFKIADIVKAAVESYFRKGLDIAISDDSAPIDQNMLYQLIQGHSTESPANQILFRQNSLKQSFTFEIAGRVWTIHFAANSEYESHSYAQSWVVLAISMVFTALLGTLLLVIVGRAAYTQAEVEDQSRQLSRTGQFLEHEIEDRKQAEDSARDNAARLNALVDNIADAIITINVNARVESFNPAAEKIFGYNSSDIIGKNINTLMPEPFKSAHDGYLKAFLNTGISKIIGVGREVKGLRKDGGITDLDLAITEMSVGQKRLFIGILRDISDRKKAEEDLRRYKKAVEKAGHIIFITNIKGKIEYVNPAFIKETGYSENDAVGKTPRILKSGRMEPIYYQTFWQTILKGDTWEQEIINRKKDGSFYYAQQTVSPITDRTGLIEGFIAVQKDITDIKKSQELLKAAKEEAESANKAKSEFLANMSHEIRTPMNAVLGFSELLSSIVTDKQQSRYLESIQTAGKSLLTLINDILDLSKIEAGKLELSYEPISLSRLYIEMQSVFEARTKEKNLEFRLEIDPELPDSLYLDESRLRQILLNLIGNAIKFTDNGYIKVAANLEKKLAENRFNISLSVEDSGIGIPRDQQTSIFDSFKQQDGQSNRKYGGTGLGLAICKRLVGIMGGKIELKSTTGAGSLFKIHLKEVQLASAETTNVSENTDFDLLRFKFEPATILVVDDTVSNRTLIQESLSRIGFNVIEAENGKVALEIVKTKRPDVILMDIRMPVMDGYEATRLLKSNDKTRDIPIIVMTASVLTETMSKIKESEFDGFLSKPAPMKTLLKELSRFLPYKENTKVTSGIEKEPGKQPITEIKDLPTLLERVNNELFPELEELKGVMEMDAIKTFGKRLLAVAEHHKVTTLASYADILLEYAEGFDISGIQETLSTISKTIKELQTNH
ncbi:PAS domain S-box protein [bacterium]|nr:PAS domain S-box protein [bacterium]